MPKPKVAICGFTSCGGCDEAVVDLNADILKVTDAVDIIFWPVVMDFKYHHIEKMADGEITLSIINGGVRDSEQEKNAKLLRKKSKLVIAFGACACFGGTPGLANLKSKEEIFQWVYHDAPTIVNPNKNEPQTVTKINDAEVTLPEFYKEVYTLDQIIDVDYYLPGCPPLPDLILNAVNAVLEGKLPPKGSTLLPPKALCNECERNSTKPEKLAMKEIKRIHEIEAAPDKCFLMQGVLCMGPATRAGCKSVCININMPCRGCFGPVDGGEQGTKFLSAFASLLDAKTDEELEKIMEGVIDPAGYLYRFTLPSSILRKKVVRILS